MLVLAVGAGVWAFVGSTWIFPQLSANSDEGIYLLQADTLLEGDLSPAAPDTEAEAFVPWFATIDDGRYVLKYTPVHASFVAAGTLLPGPDRMALAALAAIQVGAVALLATELGLRGRTRLTAVALFALSPLVLHLEITYLPYGSSLALALTAWALVLRGNRLRSARWTAAGGFAWGLVLFARPYDAILFLAIIAVAVVATHGRGRILATAVAAASGAALPLVGLAAFNVAVTGDPLQFPFNLLEPADRLGFGDRRALPDDPYLEFGPREAISALGRNLVLVVAWTGGGFVAVALAGWAVVRRRIAAAPYLAAVVVWPLGYAAFWGSYMTAFVWDGALFLGPYYYLPLVAVISIPAAVGLRELHRLRPMVAVAAVAGMAVLSLAVLVPALVGQLDRTSQRAALASRLDDVVDTPALVFLPPVYGPYLQNPFSFLRNEPGLDGPIVYALTRDPVADQRVVTMFPDRRVYCLELPRGWSDQPGFEPIIEVTASEPDSPLGGCQSG